MTEKYCIIIILVRTFDWLQANFSLRNCTSFFCCYQVIQQYSLWSRLLDLNTSDCEDGRPRCASSTAIVIPNIICARSPTIASAICDRTSSPAQRRRFPRCVSLLNKQKILIYFVNSQAKRQTTPQYKSNLRNTKRLDWRVNLRRRKHQLLVW